MARKPYPRMRPGSLAYRLTGLFLEWEHEHIEVKLTVLEIAGLIGYDTVGPVYRSALYRALYRMRATGLIHQIVDPSRTRSMLWLVPADFASRYDKWLENLTTNLEPGTRFEERGGP